MMKNIIFNNFLLDLSLIPWYGVYYSMLSINKYTNKGKHKIYLNCHDLQKFKTHFSLKILLKIMRQTGTESYCSDTKL